MVYLLFRVILFRLWSRKTGPYLINSISSGISVNLIRVMPSGTGVLYFSADSVAKIKVIRDI